MNKHDWKNDSACLGMETEDFFENYEEQSEIRPIIDSICSSCPVRKQCFASAATSKGWGVWGGVYFENGKISKEFNNHKTKVDWANTWKSLTLDEQK